jgi:hypothetical protein
VHRARGRLQRRVAHQGQLVAQDVAAGREDLCVRPEDRLHDLARLGVVGLRHALLVVPIRDGAHVLAEVVAAAVEQRGLRLREVDVARAAVAHQHRVALVGLRDGPLIEQPILQARDVGVLAVEQVVDLRLDVHLRVWRTV